MEAQKNNAIREECVVFKLVTLERVGDQLLDDTCFFECSVSAVLVDGLDRFTAQLELDVTI